MKNFSEKTTINITGISEALYELPKFNVKGFPYMMAKINYEWHVIDVNVGQAIAKVQGMDIQTEILGCIAEEGQMVAINKSSNMIQYYNIKF